MLNMENLLTYTPVQYDLVNHILTFGYAVHLVALVYFGMSIKMSAPRYRTTTILSMVVMVSAFLILFMQSRNWSETFAFDGEVYRRLPDQTFSNGYRYLNWMIDVPCLLVQMMFVLDLSNKKYRQSRNLFVVAGLAMILTGYAGQFYETASDATPFAAWGLVSTVFYLILLGVVYSVIFGHNGHLPKDAERTMQGVWWLILVSWSLYPLAYAMPHILRTADGVVARQAVYTAADISSKVIYGILLSRVASIRSAADGYGPALIEERERLDAPPALENEAASEFAFRDGKATAKAQVGG